MADSQEKVEVPTQEELNAEEEALKETSEDTIRESLVEATGLDPEDELDKAKLDKLVAKDVKAKKDLSTAIKQKRTWRDKAPKEEAPVKDKEEKTPEEVSAEKMDTLLEEKLEKRDIDSLSISEELKKEVIDYVKLNKVSVKKAMESPYIKFRIDEVGEEVVTEEASIDGGTGTATVKKDSKTIDPNKLDLTTDEGKKKFKEWEAQTAKDLG